MIMLDVFKISLPFYLHWLDNYLIPALLSGKVIIFRAAEIIKAMLPDSEPVISCSFTPELPGRQRKNRTNPKTEKYVAHLGSLSSGRPVSEV